jgi:glycosyltransferase involved in cell wall biosynthesis
VGSTAIFVSLREFALVNSRLPLIRRLQQRGWRVVAATTASGAANELREVGVEVEEVPFRRGGFSPRDMAAARQLRDLYRTMRPDLVHHFNAKPVLYGGLVASGLDETAVVSTITGLGHSFDRRFSVQGLGSKTAYRLVLPQADAVIFQNSMDLSYFIQRGWVDPARAKLIVSSGVDLARFPCGTAGADEAERVLMAVRLLWSKGVGEFIEAARVLRSRGHTTPVRLAGEWEPDHPDAVDPEYVERAEREGLIEFHGYIDDMPRALADAGIFVAPSYYREGVARVLLEAGASRRPVVAADAAGSREVIRYGDTGLLVAPRDPTSLANAIQQLLENPEQRRTMGEAAYRHVSNYFSLDTVTEQQLQVYRDIGVLDDAGSDSTLASE